MQNRLADNPGESAAALSLLGGVVGGIGVLMKLNGELGEPLIVAGALLLAFAVGFFVKWVFENIDRDPRDRKILDLLREAKHAKDERAEVAVRRLSRASSRIAKLPAASDGVLPVELMDKAKRLWDVCLSGTKRMIALRSALLDMATPEGQRRLGDALEQLAADVGGGLTRLESALDRVQAAVVMHDTPATEIHDIGDELDRGLEIARLVEERMDAFGGGPGVRDM